MKRIGLLVPSSNAVMERDFYLNLPADVSVHTGRMYMESTTVDGENRMLDEFALPAARDVATVRPHVMVFGCTSAGALRGNAYDAQLCQTITELSGAKTISVVSAASRALVQAGLKRVAVITPYIDALNERIKLSFENDGLEVVSICGMGITENFLISEVSPADVVAFARQVVDPRGADGLFVSCTNFRGVEALPELRRIYPFPVMSSNQVTLDAALQAIA
jgi:maleate isomerase